jgi:hypothetical protein
LYFCHQHYLNNINDKISNAKLVDPTKNQIKKWNNNQRKKKLNGLTIVAWTLICCGYRENRFSSHSSNPDLVEGEKKKEMLNKLLQQLGCWKDVGIEKLEFQAIPPTPMMENKWRFCNIIIIQKLEIMFYFIFYLNKKIYLF